MYPPSLYMAEIRRNLALEGHLQDYVKIFLHPASMRAMRWVCIHISLVAYAATCPFSSFILYIMDESDPITPGCYLKMVVPRRVPPKTVQYTAIRRFSSVF